MRLDHLKKIGPSLITAALIFGPGSLIINIKLGAIYGYENLWAIPLSVILMIAYTRLAAILGLTLPDSLIESIRLRYGKILAYILSAGIFLITCSFQAGNSVGVGVALAELTGISQNILVIAGGLLAICLLFFESFYAILEKMMIIMVALMLVCFFATALYSAPSLVAIGKGLIPKLPTGSTLLVTALLATSFSVVAAFFQAYLVREKGWTEEDLPAAKAETATGIILLGTIAGLVMICAAGVLNDAGIVPNSPADLAKALEPLFGRFSSVVFMLGFLGAAFSSLVGNATIGGGLLADGIGWGDQLGSRRVRLLIAVVIVVGVIIALIFGRTPLDLIVFAQAITILVAPLAAASLLLLAYNSLAKKYVSTTSMLVLGIGMMILLILACLNFKSIFL